MKLILHRISTVLRVGVALLIFVGPLLTFSAHKALAQSIGPTFVGMTSVGPTYMLPNGVAVVQTQQGAYSAVALTSYGPVVYDANHGCYVVLTAYGVAGPVVPTANGPAVMTQQGPYFLGVMQRPIYQPQPYPYLGAQPMPMPQFHRPPQVPVSQPAPAPPPQNSGGSGINIGNIIQTGLSLLPTIISLFG